MQRWMTSLMLRLCTTEVRLGGWRSWIEEGIARSCVFVSQLYIVPSSHFNDVAFSGS